MSLKKLAAKGVVWTGLRLWGRYGCSLLVFIILARLLSAEEIGLVSLALTFVWFIQSLLINGFSTYIVQREHISPQHLDTSFWANFGIGMLCTIFLFLSSDFISILFDEEALASVIRWLSLSIPIYSLSSVQEAIFYRELSFKVLTIRTLLSVSISGVLAVLMAASGFGLWSLVIQNLANSFLQLIFIWLSSSWRPKANFSTNLFREMISFELSIFGAKFIDYIAQHSNQFLIAYYLGTEALGYYSVAQRISLALLILSVNVVNQVALPILSRLQGNLANVQASFFKMINLKAMLILPIFGTVTLLATEVILTLYGSNWLTSVNILRALIISGIAQSILALNNTLFSSLGKPKIGLLVTCFNAVVNYILFFISFQFGITAVSVAYAISNFLTVPFSIHMLHKILNFDVKSYFHQYSKPFSVALLQCFIIFLSRNLLQNYSFSVQVSIQLILGITTYALVVRLIAPEFISYALGLVRLIALPSK